MVTNMDAVLKSSKYYCPQLQPFLNISYQRQSTIVTAGGNIGTAHGQKNHPFSLGS
jgi:hypothetical protein